MILINGKESTKEELEKLIEEIPNRFIKSLINRIFPLKLVMTDEVFNSSEYPKTVEAFLSMFLEKNFGHKKADKHIRIKNSTITGCNFVGNL